ncbi:MAG: hypothetical protein E7L01_31760 [Paenibacillus macerans]|nr:hypothetical protein [Paenibacillus macerans]MDU7477884.1 hypothetical protein [Paenibacillus macerans]
MHDGYFRKYIKPQYEAVMPEFAWKIYGEFKLYTDFGEAYCRTG